MEFLVTAIPLLLVVTATAFDLKKREIPDTIPVLLLAWALAATGFGLHQVGWLSLGAGLAVGFGLGAILFRMGGLGGGDVKLLAALGAALGVGEFLRTAFFIAIAGGVLSAIAVARGKRELAYGPAIALGLVAAVVLRRGGLDGALS